MSNRLLQENVAENLAILNEKIAKASAMSLFKQDVTLIAVSKQQPIDKIRAALDAGHHHFGENRIQDALQHWPALKQIYPHVILHFIGHLQTNKISDAVQWFDAIHSIDNPSLAEKINDTCRETGKRPAIFIQVNTGNEPQKSGILPQNVDAFVHACQSMLYLNLRGFMCIPPLGIAPALHFGFLKQLAEQYSLPCLSMGMSSDFETAIQLGATHVRIGTAIFGEREGKT